MKVFEVFVSFQAVGNLMSTMTKMGKQFGVLDAQAEKLQKRLGFFKNTAMLGGAMTGFGVAAAAGLGVAIKKAGDLQSAIAQLGTITKLTAGDFDTVRKIAQNVTAPTGFSQTQGVELMGAMLHGGFTKDQVMSQSVVQQMANFAELRMRGRLHEDFAESVMSASRITNAYGISAAKLPDAINHLNAALLQSGETTTEFQTQFKYVSNQAQQMGIGFNGLLDMIPWLSRMGFGTGRGGTNMAAFLNRTFLGVGGKKHDAAMAQAGFIVNGHSIFEDVRGNFVGLQQAIRIMQDFGKRSSGDGATRNRLLHAIFGEQGGRVAGAMMTGGAMDKFMQVQKAIGLTPGVNQTQALLLQQLPNQLAELSSNLGDIVTNFGMALLPDAIKLLEKVNEVVGNIKQFTQDHPGLVKMAAQFAAIGTAATIAGGGILTVFGVIGYFSPLVAAGLTPFVPALAAIGVAAGLLAIAWKADFMGMQGAMRGLLDMTSTDYAGAAFGKGARDKSGFLRHHAAFITNPTGMETTITALKKTWNDFTVDIMKDWKDVNDGVAAVFKHLMEGENAAGLQWTDFTNGMKLGWHAFENGVLDGLKKIHDAFFGLSTIPAFQTFASWANPAGNAQWGPAVAGRIHGSDGSGIATPSVRTPGHGLHSINFHGTTINVHQQPGQDGKQLARVVMRELAIEMRNKSYGSPDAILFGAT